MKIGIFDSGLGGLSVLHHAKKVMPDAQFLYYADEAHVPYGEKTPDEIRRFVSEILHFFEEQQAKAVVIACNTATSVADLEFRSRFAVPIVGMEPAVKRAVELYGESGKRILVAATPVTIAGQKLHGLLERVDHEHEADLIALPGLVRLAEQGLFAAEEADRYLEQALAGKDLSAYAAVVLGCTHFNYFKENFRRIFPEQIAFVDGNEGTIRQLQRVLRDSAGKAEMAQTDLSERQSANPVSDQAAAGEARGKTAYFFSGKPVNREERARIDACMNRLEEMYTL